MKTSTISLLLASLALGVFAAPTPAPDAALDARGRSGYNSVSDSPSAAGNYGRATEDGVITTDGRSGYNKARAVIDALVGRGRSGYNRVGAAAADTDGRSGYNKERDMEATDVTTSGRSGYNKKDVEGAAETDGRSGYNRM